MHHAKAQSKWKLSTGNRHKCQCKVFHKRYCARKYMIFCDIYLSLPCPLFFKEFFVPAIDLLLDELAQNRQIF